MLHSSKQMDESPKEVNMAAMPPPMYELIDRELLRKLMERTGDGKPVSYRALAQAAGCSHGTIGGLLDGTCPCVPVDVAHGITRRLGVGVLVLFAPPHYVDISMTLSAVGA
jgi:hypothetical protein